MGCHFKNIIGSWSIQTQCFGAFIALTTTLYTMMERLRSRLDRSSSEKNDELQSRMQQMQSPIQELLTEDLLARQDKQDWLGLFKQVGCHWSKLNKPLNQITNPLYVPINQEQRQPVRFTPFWMDIPRLDGSEPLGWIFKITQFLTSQIHQRNNEFCCFFSFGWTCTKTVWWMLNNNHLTSWTNFLHALQNSFAPPHFDIPHGALFKLTQTTIIRNYRNPI